MPKKKELLAELEAARQETEEATRKRGVEGEQWKAALVKAEQEAARQLAQVQNEFDVYRDGFNDSKVRAVLDDLIALAEAFIAPAEYDAERNRARQRVQAAKEFLAKAVR